MLSKAHHRNFSTCLKDVVAVSREGTGLGQEETEAGQSLGPGDAINCRQVENPRERPLTLASCMLILVMENKTPKAFLCQGITPQMKALPVARTRPAHRAEPGAVA